MRRRIEPRPARPPPPSQTNAPVGPTCPLSLPPTEPSGARTEVLESSVRPADERRGAVGQGWAGTPRAAATAMFRDYLRRHPLASALAADCVAAGRCLSSLRWHPVRPPSSPCRHCRRRALATTLATSAATLVPAASAPPCTPPPSAALQPVSSSLPSLFPPTPVPVPLPRRWRTATATMALAQLRWPRHLEVAAEGGSGSGIPALPAFRQCDGGGSESAERVAAAGASCGSVRDLASKMALLSVCFSSSVRVWALRPVHTCPPRSCDAVRVLFSCVRRLGQNPVPG